MKIKALALLIENIPNLGINQPKVSALKHGKLAGSSLEKLIHSLNLLNHDVEIVIKPKRKKLNAIGKLKVAFC